MNLGRKILKRMSYSHLLQAPKYEHDLPSGLREDKPDEGNAILSTSILRRAKWHKACPLSFLIGKSDFFFKIQRGTGTRRKYRRRRTCRSAEPAVECCSCNPIFRAKWQKLIKRYALFVPTRDYPLHKTKSGEIYQKVLKIAEEAGDTKTVLMFAEGRVELRR